MFFVVLNVDLIKTFRFFTPFFCSPKCRPKCSPKAIFSLHRHLTIRLQITTDLRLSNTTKKDHCFGPLTASTMVYNGVLRLYLWPFLALMLTSIRTPLEHPALNVKPMLTNVTFRFRPATFLQSHNSHHLNHLHSRTPLTT